MVLNLAISADFFSLLARGAKGGFRGLWRIVKPYDKPDEVFWTLPAF